MKQAILIFIFAVFCSMAWGQVTVTPMVLASASYGQYNCPGFMVNYTLGEMAINTSGTAPGPMVTEGFEQPIDLAYKHIVKNLPECIDTPTAILRVSAPSLNFDLFPNPASKTCQVSFIAPEYGAADFIVTDITGRQLSSVQEDFSTGTASEALDLTGLSPGSYLLILKFTNQEGINYLSVKHFSIIN